jgi:hypothetical protein
MPWRALSALLVPSAALAAGVGLQRFFEGAQPAGDALLRWLLWSSGAGLVAGALAGLALRGRILWIVYGLAAPWLAAGLVLAAFTATRPLREALADRREAACRSSGRAVCSEAEFVARCAEAAQGSGQAALGEPLQKLCDAQGCTFRWVYAGPFRSSTPAEALLCSVVADPAGKGVRYALLPL